MGKAMLRPFFRPYFILSVLAYAFVRLSRQGWYDLPEFVNSYLTDFLCMPIILTFCLVGVRWIKRIPDFRLTPLMIFGMTAFYAVLFEWILPQQSSVYTADVLDALMYFLGALLFWFVWPKPVNSNPVLYP